MYLTNYFNLLYAAGGFFQLIWVKGAKPALEMETEKLAVSAAFFPPTSFFPRQLLLCC